MVTIHQSLFLKIKSGHSDTVTLPDVRAHLWLQVASWHPLVRRGPAHLFFCVPFALFGKLDQLKPEGLDYVSFALLRITAKLYFTVLFFYFN